MILILSQSDADPTTELVADWIEALGGTWARLNGEDLEGSVSISLELESGGVKAALSIAGQQILPESVSAVWFRRWHRLQNLGAEKIKDHVLTFAAVLNHQTRELAAASRALFSRFKDAEWLSDPSTASPFKLEVLQQAAAVSLDIPSTLLTNDKIIAREFKARHGRVIVKAVNSSVGIPCDGEIALMYTSELTDDVVDSMPSQFFPSLLQELIPKSYEIRSFYLAGEFYSMAIFSQADPATEIDFRRYNSHIPNRTVPYRLPDTVCHRLRLLMERMNLETGSVDMIRSVDGRFVFLEVNPVGQFGMVSQPCNYLLEKKVARHLMGLGNHD